MIGADAPGPGQLAAPPLLAPMTARFLNAYENALVAVIDEHSALGHLSQLKHTRLFPAFCPPQLAHQHHSLLQILRSKMVPLPRFGLWFEYPLARFFPRYIDVEIQLGTNFAVAQLQSLPKVIGAF